MARIFIIGSGVVGTATGRGFIEAGHDVTFIDVLPSRLEHLTAEGYTARSEIDLGAESAFIFLTLPTPHEGRRYDLSAFDKGVTSVGRALAKSVASHTVVVRSTVPPGTTEGRVLTALERESGMTCGQGFALASNPEFLRAASAAEDFRFPWMTIIASRSKRTQERLQEILAPFGGELRMFDDPSVAEFIKCAHNIYNATKISFWNEMWLVAQKLGLDDDAIASTVADSAEGSYNRYYGIRGGAPYGGVCLPKDTNGFLGFAAEVGVDMPLLTAVVTVNELLVAANDEEMDVIMTGARLRPTVVDLTTRVGTDLPRSRQGGVAGGSA
ncbi:MAG: UDPglucose 6-dehydrogenase [Actinomycetota bacterium]|jgi:UDPglucose 6-dehydrogenase|nr:UDPglucose 6-dehydrogenase [Actinomycetota bacterium]MDQ1540222.1 UDPglucose 6-dehydrogenase [Actinomycetota bacterium]